MKKITITLSLLMIVLMLSLQSFAGVKSVKLTINTETGAKIFVDGNLVSTTTTQLKIPAYARINVRVEKPGYITQERNYINDEKSSIPPTEYIRLEKDDAFDNSFTTDLSNHDIDLSVNGLPEDEAWRLVNRVVTGYFDVVQVTDKATGYLCTAWVVKNFKSATIRTRLIIKSASSNPLSYKAKLVSEFAPPGTSATSDESFKQWDRVLRSFENLIPELQSRLGK